MFILTGRGARMREGQPKKEGRRSFVAYLPSLLGFPSRALLFLTLSSLFGSAYASGSRSLGGQGIRKAGARGRKPKGIGGMRACEFPPVPLGCHPRSVGEELHIGLNGVNWEKSCPQIPIYLITTVKTIGFSAFPNASGKL